MGSVALFLGGFVAGEGLLGLFVFFFAGSKGVGRMVLLQRRMVMGSFLQFRVVERARGYDALRHIESAS